VRWAAAASALALGGCARPAAEPPLAGPRWELADLRPARVETGGVLVPEPSRCTLAFKARGEVRARLDCNRGHGRRDGMASGTGAGTLRIGTMVVTRAFCPEERIAWRLEQALTRIRRHEPAGTEMTMTSDAEGPRLIRRRAEP
jgi:heat shock protein HslJ